MKMGFMLSLALLPVVARSEASLSSMEVWHQYVRDPCHHPQIPNCSFAGFHGGDAPTPAATREIRLADFGGLPDAITDNAPAFRQALQALAAQGGGILRLEAGRYRVESVVRIDCSNIVIRGRGPGVTILDCARPLDEARGKATDSRGVSLWGWSGGMIWVAPSRDFTQTEPTAGPITDENEAWQPGALLTAVIADAQRGDTTLHVGDPSQLRAGQWVLLVEENPANAALLREAYGHTETAQFPGGDCGNCEKILPPRLRRFLWPVRVAKIEGATVTLAQPIRLGANTAWRARLHALTDVVSHVGIEDLTLVGHARPTHPHLQGDGWNAVYFNRTADCWVKQVEVTDFENGILLASATHCTVDGVRVDGTAASHHPFACRVMSSDNLFENFVIAGPRVVMHGINQELLSSGNVWRHGHMERGTFDTHRALPFDAIYTDIWVANDTGAWMGGSTDAGPQIGRSVVRWNVTIADQETPDRRLRHGTFVNQPKLLPLGALVGVRGAPLDLSEAKAMPLGDKGTLIADPGHPPEITDLYQAQRELRLSSRP
jgi:hypothetical protein